MENEAHQANNLRDAAARHWLLVIRRKFVESKTYSDFVRMYHYSNQK